LVLPIMSINGNVHITIRIVVVTIIPVSMIFDFNDKNYSEFA
jgi:hypothetical protein